jgi:3-oxoacyl-[acyl-carrier-protein] synthase II
MDKKVVVTGMGAISPVGNSIEEFEANIKAGKSGISLIEAFPTDGYPVRIAGEVKNFKPDTWIERKDARKMARFTQFAVAAARQALEAAHLIAPGERKVADGARIGVALGNGIGGFEIVTEGFRKLFDAGPSRMPPLTVPMMIGNEAAGNIAIYFGLKGPAYTQVTACASGADALGQGLMMLRAGVCDVVVSGGTEACVLPFAIGGFSVLKTLSTRNDAPQEASRPFSKDRDGFVLGEGAGVLVLETEEHALRRGAPILAEFAGYGATCDAYHLTSPDPSGAGPARAMTLAFQDANLSPADIQYYNAHGTATQLNDAMETKALKLAFGDAVKNLKVSSTKSMIGHCIAGGGGLEAIACILAIRGGFFPPTVNLDVPDSECDLDYVPNRVQYGVVNAAASGNFGFGGHNGVVVFKKYA